MRGRHNVSASGGPRVGSAYPSGPYHCPCGWSSRLLMEAITHQKVGQHETWEDDRPEPPTVEELAKEGFLGQLEMLRAAAFDEGRVAGIELAREELEKVGLEPCPDDYVPGSSWLFAILRQRMAEL